MRALAAVVIFAGCLRCHALGDVPPTSRERDAVPQMLSILGVSPTSPLHRVFQCSTSLGPSKCLAALSIWRAEKAATVFEKKESNHFDLLDDIRQFTWEKYTNSSQDEVDRELCEGTDKLLQYRALKFKMIPGYELELASNGNGTLNVDIIKGQQYEASRGMKKKFYNIVPYLLLPGLLMSAILPFVLPALKMMTVAVGMLNNMALSGAVFTLLRNNAFNDRYEKKVIYVNQGYRNEEPSHHHHRESHHPETVYEVHHDDNNDYDHMQGYDSKQVHSIINPGNVDAPEFEITEETPVVLSSDWINQYYGNNNKKAVIFSRKRIDNSRRKNNNS